MSNVVIGRMPFTLGVALAVGAWASRAPLARARRGALARQRVDEPGGRGVPDRRRGGRARGRTRTRGEGGSGRGLVDRARARRAGRSPAGWRWPRCSPRAARTTSSAPPSGRCCSSAWARSRSSTRAGAPRCGPAGLYVAVLVAAFAFPNALGQNSLRPGLVLGPALLVLFARPRAPRRGGRRRRRRAALPAVAAGGARRRGGARRPVDGQGLPRRGAALPRPPRQAGRAARGAADAQPLGGHLPRPGLSARARLAPPARPQGQPALLRQGTASRPRATSAGCATTPSAGWRCRTRRWTSRPGEERKLLRARGCRTCGSSTRPRTGRSGRCAAREPPVSGPARLTAAGADGFDLAGVAARLGARAPARHAVLDRDRRRRLRVRGRRLGLDARRRQARRAAPGARALLGARRACGASRAAATSTSAPAGLRTDSPPVTGR